MTAIEDQIDVMIRQRVSLRAQTDDASSLPEADERRLAAETLLCDLGPEYPDEIEERCMARAYLEAIVSDG